MFTITPDDEITLVLKKKHIDEILSLLSLVEDFTVENHLSILNEIQAQVGQHKFNLVNAPFIVAPLEEID